MTRTEARLADALRASAGRVRDDRLRPLPDPGAEAAPGSRAARRGWLAPVAAAVSVVLVVGLVLAVKSLAPGHRGGPAAVTSGLPRYYAQFGSVAAGSPGVEIRSVSTGSAVETVQPPHRAGWRFGAYAMAAAPGGRTFYAAYIAIRPDTCSPCAPPQLWIYRVSPADPGLARIQGGVITVPLDVTLGFLGSMAVSPDGTRLALSAGRAAHGASGPGLLDKIVVIGLRTGSQTVWQGGLDLARRTLLIPDVSWTPDGRSVVFPALWCGAAMTLDGCENGSGPAADHVLQIRSVPVASGGGLLSRGPVLLSWGGASPVIPHALAGPRPGELTLVLLSGRKSSAGSWSDVTVERVAVPSGAVLGTEYHLVTGPGRPSPASIRFSADASGQHLLLAYRAGDRWRAGWIGQGQLHLLPVGQPDSASPVMAW